MKTLRAKTAFATVILILMIFCTYGVDASSTGNESHFGKSRHLINIINFFIDLELTPEQKDAFHELLTTTHSEIKPLMEEIRALRTEMNEVLLAEEIDTVVAEEQILEMAALKSSITTIALNAKLQGAQLLTPEQRETIESQKEEWRQRFLYWKNLMVKLFVP